jgi:hypothetical protein
MVMISKVPFIFTLNLEIKFYFVAKPIYQSKLEHYINGKPSIQIMVEETLKIEGEKTKLSTIEMDGDYDRVC